MYIIMYKYSAFRINHKSFRSSMSKNFTVIPDHLRLPVKPAMTVGPRHGGSAEMIRLASWMRRVWSQVWNVIPRVWLK